VCLNIILRSNRGNLLFSGTLVSTGKICDAVEVAGKDVLSTSSTVTTGLVSHKYVSFYLTSLFLLVVPQLV
jgi:hypothetical protein